MFSICFYITSDFNLLKFGLIRFCAHSTAREITLYMLAKKSSTCIHSIILLCFYHVSPDGGYGRSLLAENRKETTPEYLEAILALPSSDTNKSYSYKQNINRTNHVLQTKTEKRPATLQQSHLKTQRVVVYPNNRFQIS